VDAASVVERPNNLGEKRKPKAERRLKNYRQYAQAWQSLQTSAVEIQPPIALDLDLGQPITPWPRFSCVTK
jgi:hypothetical protein